MRQRFIRAVVIAMVGALAVAWRGAPLQAQIGPVCGTDLRVLVVSADGTEADLPAIVQALNYLGTPFDVFTASQHPEGIQPTMLNEDCHAFYEGVILTTNTAVAANDLQTLATYEAGYHVRQVTWYTWPTPNDGFNWATSAGSDPTNATLTPAGAQVFSYLNTSPAASPIPITNAWTYLATPLDASTQSLLTDGQGHALAAIHTFPDGHQNLAMTFDSNQYLTHALLLSYGVIDWVTNGVFVGDRHVYMSPQVDDFFLDDTQWLTTTPCGTNVDLTGGDFRLLGSDLTAVSNWQKRARAAGIVPDMRLTLAFNGIATTADFDMTVGGHDTLIGGSTAPGTLDTLTPVAKQLQGEFWWASHTFDHENLDALSYADSVNEIVQNNAVAAQLGLTTYTTKFLVQPDISGLGNPAFLQAAYDNGLRYLLSDTSHPEWDNPSPNVGFVSTIQPGIFIIPRRANNLFFNVTTPADWVAEYNCLYESYWGRAFTYDDVLDNISDGQLQYLLKGEMDPWMFHQPNLAAYDGTHTLISDLLDRTIAKYAGYMSLPILTPNIEEIGTKMQNRTLMKAAGVTATLEPNVGIVVSSPATVTVPITGVHLPGAEWYGGQWISNVDLVANQPVTIPLAATAPLAPPVLTGTITADGRGTVTSPSFDADAGTLLLAFAAADGSSSSSQQLTISGAGLTWTLVARSNAQRGTSEIWKATATAPLSNASVTSTESKPNLYQSITIATFSGASDVGVSATAGARTGAPSVSLTTSAAGSFVFGVGNDWDGAVARTPVTGQTLMHQYLTPSGDTLWVQQVSSAVSVAGTTVAVADSAPTSDRWNLAAVEVLPTAPTAPPTFVIVPSVIGLTQSDAASMLAAAGLTIGDVVPQSDPTAPAGTVLTQTPPSGAQAQAGSAVALTVSTGPAPASPTVDTTVNSDGNNIRTVLVTTPAAGDVLVAFIGADGPGSGSQTAVVAGGGLTWSLVARANGQAGTSEIWTATAATPLSAAKITSTLSRTGYHQSLVVVAFAGASGVGVSATAGARTGAPSVSLAGAAVGSLVYGVGNDWDNALARTLPPDQMVVHQDVDTAAGDTFWTQQVSSPLLTSATVQLNAIAPTNDRWNLAAVEVRRR